MNIKPLPPDTPIPTRAVAQPQPQPQPVSVPTKLAEPVSTENKGGRPRGPTSVVACDAVEKEKRNYECAIALLEFKHPGKVKATLSEKWGIERRSVEPYIRDARLLLSEWAEMTKQELRDALTLKYFEIIEETNSSDKKSQLVAMRQLADLNGANLTVLKVAATNQGGEDITPGASGAPSVPVAAVDPRKALADLLNDIVVDGEPTPSPGQSIPPVPS